MAATGYRGGVVTSLSLSLDPSTVTRDQSQHRNRETRRTRLQKKPTLEPRQQAVLVLVVDEHRQALPPCFRPASCRHDTSVIDGFVHVQLFEMRRGQRRAQTSISARHYP